MYMCSGVQIPFESKTYTIHAGDADNTAAFHRFRAILLPVILSK